MKMERRFRRTPSNTTMKRTEGRESADVPQDLWRKCAGCGRPVYREAARENEYICPRCGAYFRMTAPQRIRQIADAGSFQLWQDGEDQDPLNFPGYVEKREQTRKKTGISEAVLIGAAKIGGYPAVLGVCDTRFFMGSMGTVMGERITRAVERATEERLPVVLTCCSGGARMQEGILSLMQMAKTAAAMKRHSDAGLLSVCVLTDPTTGGVTASFASLGDIILAEPGALIGFAGPRVIEQTIGKKLPEGFQQAEFLLEHGFVDQITERKMLKARLAWLLKVHEQNPSKTRTSAGTEEDGKPEQCLFSKKREEEKSKRQNLESAEHAAVVGGEKRTPWETVLLSRSADRPTSLEYIQALFPDFEELHGDRRAGDDGAIIGGIATFHGCPVTVIGQQKGRNRKENRKRNSGMPSPEGYRKALRLMKQAEKFHRPVICLIDTPGAYCGLEAEEHGQGQAIAENLYEMSTLKTPILSLVIGEGGSGGALALGIADEVWMMENSVYSILSPEGFASILWKDSRRAEEAAAVMRMRAMDLKELRVIEKIIPEETPVRSGQIQGVAAYLERELMGFLSRASQIPEEERIRRRYARFRRL